MLIKLNAIKKYGIFKSLKVINNKRGKTVSIVTKSPISRHKYYDFDDKRFVIDIISAMSLYVQQTMTWVNLFNSKFMKVTQWGNDENGSKESLNELVISDIYKDMVDRAKEYTYLTENIDNRDIWKNYTFKQPTDSTNENTNKNHMKLMKNIDYIRDITMGSVAFYRYYSNVLKIDVFKLISRANILKYTKVGKYEYEITFDHGDSTYFVDNYITTNEGENNIISCNYCKLIVDVNVITSLKERMFKCGNCQKVYYCGKYCQQQDWRSAHYKVCDK